MDLVRFGICLRNRDVLSLEAVCAAFSGPVGVSAVVGSKFVNDLELVVC
jgi:hypothetical protein